MKGQAIPWNPYTIGFALSLMLLLLLNYSPYITSYQEIGVENCYVSGNNIVIRMVSHVDGRIESIRFILYTDYGDRIVVNLNYRNNYTYAVNILGYSITLRLQHSVIHRGTNTISITYEPVNLTTSISVLMEYIRIREENNGFKTISAPLNCRLELG